MHLPVIAAVNGPAVGLGCTIATACDFVLVSDKAFLADPHVQVALVAGDGGAITWPLSVGLLRAKQYLLTGDRISPEVAVELGLATRVVPADSLMDEALALARKVAALPPQAVQDTKAVLNQHLRHGRSHVARLRARRREPVARHSRVPRSARDVPRAEGMISGLRDHRRAGRAAEGAASVPDPVLVRGGRTRSSSRIPQATTVSCGTAWAASSACKGWPSPRSSAAAASASSSSASCSRSWAAR